MRKKRRAPGEEAPEGGGRMKALKLCALAVAGLAVAGAVCYGIYGFARGPMFTVTRVMFEGNRYLGGARLGSLSGIAPGGNIWDVSLEDAALRLKASPWVRSASLRKDLPRTVIVRVEESEPVAILKHEGGVLLVDGRGKTLERLRGETVSFLPVLAGDPASAPRAYALALDLAGVLKRLGIPAGSERVEIRGFEGGAEEISLRVDGLLVKVGDGEYERKLERFLALRDEIRKLEIEGEYVDLRFANRVVVKPVVEQVVEPIVEPMVGIVR